MIGIIGAMDIEIEKLQSDLKNKKVRKIAFLEFYTHHETLCLIHHIQILNLN